MARPIEATPTLGGRRAARFIKAINNPQPYHQPVLDLKTMRNLAKQLLESNAKKQK